jgi:hypothetical protein
VKLFLWKLSQDENNDYETYDSAVVVARDPVNASMIHPARYSDTGEAIFSFDKVDDCWRRIDGDHVDDGGWARPNDVKVVCVGEAGSFLKYGEVICSSYNAG